MKSANTDIIFKPIGVIHSPHHTQKGTPIQPVYAGDVEGDVIVYEDFEPALDDIMGFERIWLIYLFDRAGEFKQRVIPYRDTHKHGLFATRSPSRPNPIGMSVVRLLSRSGSSLKVSGIDVLDASPLIDIKPYVPTFDAFSQSKAGWLDSGAQDTKSADERFEK